MKTSVKLESLIPVLSAGMVDSLRQLERECSGFSIQNAELKRATVSNDAASLAEGERAAVKYISTRTVDRYNEVLDPEGAILKQYEQNPVVLWAHDYSQPPIGKSAWVRSDGYGLKSKTIYANTQRGEEVWQLVKGGFIKTSSVGFIPIERFYKNTSGWRNAIDKYNALWDSDLEKAGCEILTTKWALLEYSDVPVPCNPDALVTAVAKGMPISAQTLTQLGIRSRSLQTGKHKGVIELISEPQHGGIIELIYEPPKLIRR